MIRLPFADRAEAGRLLAAELAAYKLQGDSLSWRCLGVVFPWGWKSQGLSSAVRRCNRP